MMSNFLRFCASRPASLIRTLGRTIALSVSVMDAGVQLRRLKLMACRPVVGSFLLHDLDKMGVAGVLFFRHSQQDTELMNGQADGRHCR